MDQKFIKDNWYVDPSLLFFNYGNFGVCPRIVMNKKFKLMEEFQKNPYNGYSRLMFDESEKSVDILAKRLDCDPSRVAIVTNVTNGVSATIQSLPKVEFGDAILVTEWTYGAVKMEVNTNFVRRGGVVKEMKMELDWLCSDSEQSIVDRYVNFVEQNPSIKFAIIDHIMSPLPVVQPVKAITRELRERFGVFVIVDGAHAPGQIRNLSIADIDADVYIGNLHKWYFLPPGTGILVVRPEAQINMRPSIVSWMYGDEVLNRRFLFLGTQDVTNALCVESAMEFVDALGGLDKIHDHNIDILDRGIASLENKWDVSCIPFTTKAPFTRLIPLPIGFQEFLPIFKKLISQPFERPFYEYTERRLGFIATPVIVRDRLHFRLCCQVASEVEQFEKFGDKVLEWLELLRCGEIPPGGQ